MNNSILAKCLLVTVSLPLLSGCVVYKRQPPAAEGVPAGSTVVVTTEPPPPRVEVIPACPGPVDLWFWVSGCWVWRDHWVWAGGHWAERPHPQAVWVTGHWSRHYYGYVWVEGHWR